MMAHSFKVHSAVVKLSRHIQNRSLFSFAFEQRLCQQRHFHSAPRLNQSASRLTPQEVSAILRANEYTSEEISVDGNGPVKAFDINTLRSNDPVEDSHNEVIVRPPGSNEKSDPTTLLFGVFDGHGGAACGQVVGKRLLQYVAAGLLSYEDLTRHLQLLEVEKYAAAGGHQLVQTFHDPFELVQDLKEIYRRSYIEYVRDIHRSRIETDSEVVGSSVSERLVAAFNALDNDMSNEALAWTSSGNGSERNSKTLTVAMSGSVAVVAHIDGPMLHVASTGDCTAVLGSLSENDTWIAKKLTTEHNSDNAAEVKRILNEHPKEEERDIIRGDRLLGILAPLRAFGDFKFKWAKDTIIEAFGNLLSKEQLVPPNYKTPPYLTATPDVKSHKLTPRDKFLVLGSDGLWDLMTPMQVIRLVGEHMSGKVTLSPLNLNQQVDITLGDIASVLNKRQAALKLKPQDSNAATHLIRCALGGTAYGVDHGRLSQMLSLPQDMVRMFRDDITVTVIFFDAEYLRHS